MVLQNRMAPSKKSYRTRCTIRRSYITGWHHPEGPTEQDGTIRRSYITGWYHQKIIQNRIAPSESWRTSCLVKKVLQHIQNVFVRNSSSRERSASPVENITVRKCCIDHRDITLKIFCDRDVSMRQWNLIQTFSSLKSLNIEAIARSIWKYIQRTPDRCRGKSKT